METTNIFILLLSYFSFHAYFCAFTRVNLVNKFQLQAGKLIASEAVAMILQGLHMSGTSFHFEFNNDIEGRLVSPVSCRDCICRTHNLFGVQLQMSCRCGNSFDEKEHTTVFYKLHAGSPQTTKVCHILLFIGGYIMQE